MTEELELFEVRDLVTWKPGYEPNELHAHKYDAPPFLVAQVRPAEPQCTHGDPDHFYGNCPEPYPLAHPQCVYIMSSRTGQILGGEMTGFFFCKV